MISIQPFFVLLFLCRAVAGKCVDIDLQLVNSAKRMFDRAASLRLSGKFDAELNVFNLELDFSPPLLLNEDYKLEPVHPYKLPVPYQKDSKLNSFRVLLKPGRTWSKTNITGENEDDGKTTNIMLQGARYCDARPTNGSGKTMQPVHLATVNPLSVYKCPKLFNMTRVSAEFQSYIDGILTHCQVPKVITIGQLAIKKISPLSLLYLQPPVLFIDARRGNKLRRSARIIDTFLASHSVLDVVWEPLNATEPLWWVLMPKPMGMPGHLFAMMDYLQWKHPVVTNAAARYASNYNCTKESPGCVPGCSSSKVVVTWCSGWGADTNQFADNLQRSIIDYEPLQIGPVRMPSRKSSSWNNKVGWHYTFGACKSNFLDCFFLDHSPCPPITIDVWNDPGKIYMNQSRFQSSHPENDHFDARPAWWQKVVGRPHQMLPETSISDIRDSLALHAFYSYFVRPKYQLRSTLQRQLVRFQLEQDSCAFMHVRRGDVLLHGDRSRAYIPVYLYVKAARIHLDTFGISTILLLTDSAAAIEEAMACATEHPEVCSGINFRFLEKERWKGAEGGWENPFPTGVMSEELLAIQLEFALVQKCAFGITGDSNYAQRALAHMACKSPLAAQGVVPQRCQKIPYIRVEQAGFDCKGGYDLVCAKDYDLGGNHHLDLRDPSNMLAANFSFTPRAFRNSTKVEYNTPNRNPFFLDLKKMVHSTAAIKAHAVATLDYLCTPILDRTLPRYCTPLQGAKKQQ